MNRLKKILSFTVFLGVLAGFGNEGWVKLYKLRQHESVLEDQNRLVADHNLELQFEIERLKDPKYLEAYVRREMGYVRDNELVYEFVSVTPAP